jgi:hypothetical protein
MDSITETMVIQRYKSDTISIMNIQFFMIIIYILFFFGFIDDLLYKLY